MERKDKKLRSFKLIAKGKLRGVEVTYSDRYVDENGAIIEVVAPKELHKVEPHEDLTAAMAALSPHYANILEWEEYTARDVVKGNVITGAAAQFPVRGVIFKEGTEWSGAMLSGHRKQSTGHALNMLTRLVKFNDEGEQYELADELQEAVEAVRNEVLQLLAGKHAKPAQLNITDPDNAVEETEDVEV